MSLTVVERERTSTTAREARPLIVKEVRSVGVSVLLQVGQPQGIITLILEMVAGIVLLIIGYYIYAIIYNLIGSTVPATLVTIFQAIFVIVGVVLLVHAVWHIIQRFRVAGAGAGP